MSAFAEFEPESRFSGNHHFSAAAAAHSRPDSERSGFGAARLGVNGRNVVVFKQTAFGCGVAKAAGISMRVDSRNTCHRHRLFEFISG
jgi:hypothetical protein